MLKKSQTSLVFNTVLGLLFIFAAFALFLYSNYKIEDAKENSINQVLQTDMLATYTGVMSKLEPRVLDDFNELEAILDADENYFQAQRNFETFQNSILAGTEDNDIFRCSLPSETFQILSNPASYGLISFFTSSEDILESGEKYFIPGWFFYVSDDSSVQASSLCLIFTNGIYSRWIE